MSLRTVSVKVNNQTPVVVDNVSYDNVVNVRISDNKTQKIQYITGDTKVAVQSASVGRKDSPSVDNVSFDNLVNVKLNGKSKHKVKLVDSNIRTLSQLEDVYSINPEDGFILTYNSSLGMYVSNPVDFSLLQITNIDCGTF